MIRLRKNYDQPPEILLGDACQHQIQTLVAEKNGKLVSSYYYAHEHIHTTLDQIYHGKCAYCEGKPKGTSKLRIDHYRPKDKIKGEPPNVLGYYWLGYEWSNLLPACDECNRFKSNAFPIRNRDARVCEPEIVNGELGTTTQRADGDALQMEQPLILNPERRYPEYHIVFLKDGKIKGITEEGRITVEVCKLDRHSAKVIRWTKIDTYVRGISKIIDKYFAKTINEAELKTMLVDRFEDLFDACMRERPYSRLSWFMYAHFDTFILPRFGSKTQQMLKTRFEIFKADQPSPPRPMPLHSADPANTP